MRGEDLLQERRAGAREPQNEDRFAAGRAVAVALAEKLARTDPLLVRGVLLQKLRPIAALGALERVAALVVAEGHLVGPAVLVRLAEREAQVVAVDQRGRRVRLGRLEPRDLLGGELVGLEVREAPVRVAEVRPNFDRFGAPAEGLQRVRDR